MANQRCKFHVKPGDQIVTARDCEEPAHHEDWDTEMLTKALTLLEGIAMYSDVRAHVVSKFPGLMTQIDKTIAEIKAV